MTKTLLASFVSICLSTSVGGFLAPVALAAPADYQVRYYDVSSSGHMVTVASMPRAGGYIGKGVWESGPVRISLWQAGAKVSPVTQPAPVTTPNPTPTAKPAPSSAAASAGATAEEQQALRLLNADRVANGLPNLRLNNQLTSLAEYYAQDMINRNFFSHNNPQGQSPFDRMRQRGISYGYAGENLAINNSVPSAESAFMNSPGHRANILSPHYTQVGVGVRHGNNGSVYVVQEFIDG